MTVPESAHVPNDTEALDRLAAAGVAIDAMRTGVWRIERDTIEAAADLVRSAARYAA